MKSLSSPRIKSLFFILIICIFISCDNEKIQNKKPIKIAINIWPGYAYAFIAKEKGLFRKNNVDVELVLKKNISESSELYINDEVDGIFDVFSNIVIHSSEGISAKVVYIIDYSDKGDVIIGRSDMGSLSNLKGKKVGFEGVNSFSHMFVLESLKKTGLKEFDFFCVNIPCLDVLGALEQGKIDAGHTWEPVVSKALKKGYKILATAGDIPGIITDVLAFKPQLITERPEDIQNIVKSLAEARDFVYSNFQEAVSIMSRAENMSEAEMSSGVVSVHLLNLEENISAIKDRDEATSLYQRGKAILEFYSDRGQLSADIDLNEIIEPRFLIEKDKE